MTMLLGLRGLNSTPACYGILAADPWDFATGTDYSTSIDPFDYTLPRNKQTSACHLIIVGREDAADDHVLYEVSYDTADLESTFRVPGHPTVVGVFVSTYTLTGNTCTPPPPTPPLSPPEKIEAYLPDPTIYVITEA